MTLFIIVFNSLGSGHPEAIAIMKHLGYPYLLPFLVGGILGIIAVLVPAFHKAKEWAFAGVVFDLLEAFFSYLSFGDPPGKWIVSLPAKRVINKMRLGRSYPP